MRIVWLLFFSLSLLQAAAQGDGTGHPAAAGSSASRKMPICREKIFQTQVFLLQHEKEAVEKLE